MKTATVPDRAHAQPGRGNASWRMLLGVAAVTIGVRLVFAITSYGTSDVPTWELLGRMLLNGENFYATQLHNWPALWIYFCAAAVIVHDATGIPFWTLIKLPPIAADACIAVLICSSAPLTGWRKPALAGLAFALNPISILITGYHGQFDSLMLAPTVLAWRLFDRHHVGSALALGLGIWFKPVPLLILPVLLSRLQIWRARFTYLVLCLLPASLGTLPYFVMWPQDVAANFLGYSSWFGQWGYPVVWMLLEYVRYGTIPWWLPDPAYVSPVLHLMFGAGKWILLAALGIAWWLTYRRKADVLHSIVAMFATFYAVTTGFGVQYLEWIVPFATLRRDRWLWIFSLVGTFTLVVAYALGDAYRVLPVTPDNAPSMREFVVKLATLPTWIVCVLWAWSALGYPDNRDKLDADNHKSELQLPDS